MSIYFSAPVLAFPMPNDVTEYVIRFYQDPSKPGAAHEQFEAALGSVIAAAVEADRRAWGRGEPAKPPCPACLGTRHVNAITGGPGGSAPCPACVPAGGGS